MNQIITKNYTSSSLSDLEYGYAIDSSTQAVLRPDSGSVNIYKDGELLESGVPTIDASKKISYSFSGYYDVNFDYRAEFILTKLGVEIDRRVIYFDILAFSIETKLNDSDISIAFPALDELKIKKNGYVESGTSLFSFEDTKRNEVTNVFKGGQIRFLSGDNAGFKRQINMYNQYDGTIEVVSAWPYTPQKGDAYEIEISFYPSMRESFKRIVNDLQRVFGEAIAGYIVDPNDLYDSHKYLTIANLCLQRREIKEDTFDLAYRDYNARFENAFRNLQLKITSDLQDSAIIDDSNLSLINPLRYWGR